MRIYLILSIRFGTMALDDSSKIVDITKYNECKLDVYKKIESLKTDPRRFQSIHERRHESVFDLDLIKKVSKGICLGV